MSDGGQGQGMNRMMSGFGRQGYGQSTMPRQGYQAWGMQSNSGGMQFPQPGYQGPPSQSPWTPETAGAFSNGLPQTMGRPPLRFDGSTQDLGNGMQIRQMGPSMLPPEMAPTQMAPQGPRDAMGNVYADRNSSPRAATGGAFNPAANQWGEYGQATGDGLWGTDAQGINRVNGHVFAPSGLTSGNNDFANWMGRFAPQFAQQNGPINMGHAFVGAPGAPAAGDTRGGSVGTGGQSGIGRDTSGFTPGDGTMGQPMPSGLGRGAEQRPLQIDPRTGRPVTGGIGRGGQIPTLARNPFQRF